MVMMRASRSKAVQEPVVKSCSRVPTAKMQSACAAIALAEFEPVTPIGPMFSGVAMQHIGAPGDGFHDRDVVLFGKAQQFC